MFDSGTSSLGQVLLSTFAMLYLIATLDTFPMYSSAKCSDKYARPLIKLEDLWLEFLCRGLASSFRCCRPRRPTIGAKQIFPVVEIILSSLFLPQQSAMTILLLAPNTGISFPPKSRLFGSRPCSPYAKIGFQWRISMRFLEYQSPRPIIFLPNK
jgi:hypothetical protein